jgi:hypothetical protein
MTSPVFGPMAVAGRANFDGEEGMSVRFTTASSFAVDRDSRYTGTYSVTRDCRAEIRMNGLEHPHFGIGDYHLADFYLAAGGRRVFYIATKAWIEEVGGVGVDPLGINEELTHGNEGEFNFTHTGVLARTTRTIRFDPHVRLLLGRTRGLHEARRDRPFRIRVRALGGRLRRVRVVMRDARSRRVGRSRRFTVGTRRKSVRVRVGRPLRPARYRIVATGRDRAGRRVRAVRWVRLTARSK